VVASPEQEEEIRPVWRLVASWQGPLREVMKWIQTVSRIVLVGGEAWMIATIGVPEAMGEVGRAYIQRCHRGASHYYSHRCCWHDFPQRASAAESVGW